MVNWREHIESNPDILFGKPTLIGTRISVEFIMERLSDGWSEQEIVENYPSLTKESINAVYAYVYEFLKDAMIYSIRKMVA